MSRANLLADGILLSAERLTQYLAGFDDSNHTRQAPSLPNHAAWSLGHLALTMHRVAARLDGAPDLPPEHFIENSTDLARGDHQRFAAGSVAFKSSPTDDASAYPTWARCNAIFNHAARRLADALRNTPDAALDAPTPWATGHTTIALLAMRLMYHNGMHAGQIADLRRALAMKRVLE